MLDYISYILALLQTFIFNIGSRTSKPWSGESGSYPNPEFEHSAASGRDVTQELDAGQQLTNDMLAIRTRATAVELLILQLDGMLSDVLRLPRMILQPRLKAELLDLQNVWRQNAKV